MKESIYLTGEQLTEFLFLMTDEDVSRDLAMDVDDDGIIDLVVVGIELVEQ